MGEIENWSERGSSWEVENSTTAYVNVARYQPLRGETYIKLPKKLASKKTIINMKNTDEFLKWALRSALFPVQKDAQRPSKYPTNDEINWKGISFPTPLKQINNKLEKQNPRLATNVSGWENCVIVHRISKNEKRIKRSNMMSSV